MPIGIYGQKQYILCTCFQPPSADIAKGLYPYILREILSWSKNTVREPAPYFHSVERMMYIVKGRSEGIWKINANFLMPIFPYAIDLETYRA